MKLEKIYRDIFSILNIESNQVKIYSLDVINCINDVIAQLIPQYVNRGLGSIFTITEEVTDFMKDQSYPFAFSSELDLSINQDVPIEDAIKSPFFKGARKDLKDEVDSATIGDVRYKDGSLFVCVESYDDLNTFDLSFNPKEASQFFPGNSLFYFEGDVVRDIETDSWWIALEDYHNDESIDIEDTESFEQLYWKRTGNGHFEGNLVGDINRLRLGQEFESYKFFVHGCEVYANTNNVLVIKYIPEWEHVTDLDRQLAIPQSLSAEIIENCVSRLRNKIPVPDENRDG